MRNRRIYLLIFVSLLLFAAAGRQGLRLKGARGGRGSVELQDAPPIVMFTSVALGGLNGILADILWLRASLLQDEGRYFELVQLADWVTRLEPGLGDVWVFHSWNMAYNISVMMPRPEDRWRWVQNGISLLRDQGIKFNPRDPNVFFQLGWLFQNKIGESIDVMHLYYKRQLANQVIAVIGENGRMDYSPVPGVMREKLSSEFGFDVELMERIDVMYGPLDWRLPEAHAVYWGMRGFWAGGAEGSMSCERLVYQSMMLMFRRGRLEYDADAKSYITSMEPDRLPAAIKAFEEVLARYPDDHTVAHSYGWFLRDAVRRLAAAGMNQNAMNLFEKLAAEYGDIDTANGYEAFLLYEES